MIKLLHDTHRDYVLTRMKNRRRFLYPSIDNFIRFLRSQTANFTEAEAKQAGSLIRELGYVKDEIDRIVLRVERMEGVYLGGPAIRPATKLLNQICKYELALTTYEELCNDVKTLSISVYKHESQSMLQRLKSVLDFCKSVNPLKLLDKKW